MTGSGIAERAVAPLGAADGPPALAALFECTGVAAITADTPPEEVAARLEALRRRLQLAERLVAEYLAAAGWPDSRRFVARALAGPGAAVAAAPPPAPIGVRYPALTRWRQDVGAGRRTVHLFDALWRAASWEAAALEAERDGLPDTAGVRMRCARDVLAEAAAATQQGQAA